MKIGAPSSARVGDSELPIRKFGSPFGVRPAV